MGRRAGRSLADEDSENYIRIRTVTVSLREYTYDVSHHRNVRWFWRAARQRVNPLSDAAGLFNGLAASPDVRQHGAEALWTSPSPCLHASA